MKFQVGDKLKSRNGLGSGWLHGSVITFADPDAEFNYTATKAGELRTFTQDFVEDLYEKDEGMTAGETRPFGEGAITKVEFEALKAQVVEKAREAAKEHAWCDVVEKLLKETGLVEGDTFGAGTVLAVETTAYIAFKHFGGRTTWTFASAGLVDRGLTFEEAMEKLKTNARHRPIVVLRDGGNHTNGRTGEVLSL